MSKRALKLIREAKERRAEYLDIGKCGLTELPEELFELTWLKILIVSNEWLDREIGEWKNSLNKGASNKLSHLPDALESLVRLETLIIRGDDDTYWAISDLKPLEKLTALTMLYCGKNQVRELPVFFREFKELRALNLQNNKFEVGEEIYNLPIAERIEAILQWQEAKRQQTLKPVLEAKVMFVGDSKKGKTHLIEMLLNGKFSEGIPTTHGIERHRLPDVGCLKGDIRINVGTLAGSVLCAARTSIFSRNAPCMYW